MPLTSPLHRARGARGCDAAPLHRRCGRDRLPRRLLEHRRRGTAAAPARSRPPWIGHGRRRAAAARSRSPVDGRRWARSAGRCGRSAPALLRVRLGIDEVVTTLLLNPVALLLVNGAAPRPVARPGDGLPGVAAHRGDRGVPAAPRALARCTSVSSLAWSSSRSPGSCSPGRRPGCGCGRSGLSPRRPGSRASTSSDAARRRARERRHRGHRGRERGGRHPVPADRGLSPGFGYTGHRRRDAGRAHDAGRRRSPPSSSATWPSAPSSAGATLGVPSQLARRHPGRAAAARPSIALLSACCAASSDRPSPARDGEAAVMSVPAADVARGHASATRRRSSTAPSGRRTRARRHPQPRHRGDDVRGRVLRLPVAQSTRLPAPRPRRGDRRRPLAAGADGPDDGHLRREPARVRASA